MSFFKKKPNNKVVYKIININENTKDRECIEADSSNQKIYRKIVGKVGNAVKNWENTGVTLNLEVPPPPIPNNYDRLLIYRKQNVLRPAIDQSQATLYLYDKEYILGKDYNAYEAIELANKLKIYENEDINLDDNVFENNENEIIPKKNNSSNINLDILKISPKLERKRGNKKRLSFQEPKNKNINIDLREIRSNSLDSKKSNSEPNINDKIFSFQMMSKQNKTKKEDLLPTEKVVPSAPPLYLS
jgi:hypothetical protein